jgi:predicted transcriptional regulator
MPRSEYEHKLDILRLLCEKDTVQTRLSEKLHINPTTTKKCLLAMKKAGLLTADGRVYSITADGRKISEMAEKVREAMEAA